MTNGKIPIHIPASKSHERHPDSVDTEDATPTWQIHSSDVQSLPEIYPRITYPLIFKGINTEVIGKRLFQFMRTNSIRCKYDTDQAKVVGCTTQASFVVQLWRPRYSESKTKNDHNDTIIIEVTRRRGCCIVTHKIRHALAKSLLSDNDPIQFGALMSSCHQFKPSLRIKAICNKQSCDVTKMLGVKQQLYHFKAFETLLELLESDAYDEQDHGMETFAYMSDITKVPMSDAKLLATLLVFRQSSQSQHNSDQGARIQNAVEDYVYGLEHLRPRVIEENSYNHTLTTLSNALELITKDMDPESISAWVKNSSPMLFVYWRHMLHFFLSRLKSFQQSPESAALAAKSIRLLSYLTSCSGEGIEEMKSFCEDLPPVLRDAYHYGRNYNTQLEREASDLSETVNSIDT